MTERLSARALREDGGTVFVEPEVVVEVLFSDLQRSPTYRAGLALRFARVLRVRDDKAVAEIDTLAHLRGLLAAQEAHRVAPR
jgi:DNA ligase-1